MTETTILVIGPVLNPKSANTVIDTVTNTETTFQRKNLAPKTIFVAKYWRVLDNFWQFRFIFMLVKLIRSVTIEETFEKLRKKVSAQIPIPKLDLCFGSQYWNLVSVAPYLLECYYARLAFIQQSLIFLLNLAFIWSFVEIKLSC